ncbi:hypothetical protein VTN02DRAFT_4511 [Thermoascus thermophilus]
MEPIWAGCHYDGAPSTTVWTLLLHRGAPMSSAPLAGGLGAKRMLANRCMVRSPKDARVLHPQENGRIENLGAGRSEIQRATSHPEYTICSTTSSVTDGYLLSPAYDPVSLCNTDSPSVRGNLPRGISSHQGRRAAADKAPCVEPAPGLGLAGRAAIWHGGSVAIRARNAGQSIDPVRL